MCEILGYSGSRKRQLNQDLKAFFSHANEHPNGWGLALFYGGNAEIDREEKRADWSDHLAEKLKNPISAKNAFAHIRLATIGDVELKNCHPFVGEDHSKRRWTLVHNGTIFESDKLSQYVFVQKGETDSERILLYILDRMNEKIKKTGAALSAKERFRILDEIVRNSSPKNKLNFLLYDGEITYVHTNFKGSLYRRHDPYGVTFSSRPLSDGAWEPVDFTTLLGYRDGELVFKGTDHHHEYFFDEESYKPLYLAYAGL